MCAAIDVHYPRNGGARAAAVLAADAAFAHVLAERTPVLPGYRPTGQASSTCATSRRCARSWTMRGAGLGSAQPPTRCRSSADPR
jgi:hypothetical protein